MGAIKVSSLFHPSPLSPASPKGIRRRQSVRPTGKVTSGGYKTLSRLTIVRNTFLRREKLNRRDRRRRR